MIEFEKTDGGRAKHFPMKFKKDITGDCVPRALSIATSQDYLKVWKDLFKMGLKSGFLPNTRRVYGKYLEKHGFVKMKTLKKCSYSNKKYKVKEFPASEDRTYVIRTNGHLTCIKGRVLYDLWNCGPWCAFSYWVK